MFGEENYIISINNAWIDDGVKDVDFLFNDGK